MNRLAQKPKDTNKVEAEEQKERREKAESTKQSLAKMSPAERTAWYTKQKEERRTQERGSKRTFSTGVGFCQEEETHKFGEKEKDVFETCEMWCARMMILKKYETLEEAETGFKNECKKATAKTKTVRGQTLLCSFQGLEVALGKEHSLVTGIRQRSDITEKADLQDFKDEVEARSSKAQWRLESDHRAFLEGSFVANTDILNVAQDLAKAKAIEAEQEAQWMETLEQTAANKKQEKKVDNAPKKSLGVETMAMEASMQRSAQAMTDCINRQKTLAFQASEESKLLETEQLRDEASQWEDRVQRKVPEVLKEVEDLKAGWKQSLQKGVQEKDPQKAHESSVEVAKDLKNWLQTGVALKEYKQEIKDWKAFLAKCKVQSRKKDKHATKASSATMSSGKLGSGCSWSGLPVCKQSVDALKSDANLLGDAGVAWSLDKDVLDVADLNTDCSPVVVSPAQAKPFCAQMTEHEYYTFQKIWVSEQKKKMTGPSFLSAQMTKATVSKKISTLWSKLTGRPNLAWLQSADNQVTEIFGPQFFQQGECVCQAHLHADFGLPEARLLFEGCAYLVGMPLSKVPGNTLHEKREWLMVATWASFMQHKTWSLVLTPDKGVVIPGDHLFLSISMEESHGDRTHLLAKGHAYRTLKLCEEMVADNSALASLKTGKVLESLRQQLQEEEKEIAVEPPAKRVKHDAKPVPKPSQPANLGA